MLRTALVLLVVLWLAAPAAAVGASDPGPMLVETPRGVSLLERGRAEMLALRLDAADRSFYALAAQPSAEAAARFHLAKTALWRAMILEQGPLYDRFFERSDSLLAVLGPLPDSPWKTHFRAEAELQRAIVHGKKAEYARAAMAMRQAYNHFERNVKEHPTFFESYVGMGLCHVAVGSVPKKFRWLLNLMGFGGTVAEGLREMRVAADRSTYYREEATVYFAFTDQIINEAKEDGLERLAALHRRHPESPVTGYVYGLGLLNDRRAADAEAVLRRAQDRLDAPGTFALPYVTYYLADALFAQDRFEEAALLFQRFLRDFPGQALVAQAHLHAGLALEMSGRRADALAHYERIRVREDYDSDAAARRQAEDRLAAPMTPHERALLLGRNALDSGRYREAVATLQPVLGDQAAPAVQRAEAAYSSGRAYHFLGKHREAIRHYRFAVDRPGDPLAKWGPWSQFYIGEAHEADGEHAAARAAYERALAYDGAFAYHKALEQRARAALSRL